MRPRTKLLHCYGTMLGTFAIVVKGFPISVKYSPIIAHYSAANKYYFLGRNRVSQTKGNCFPFHCSTLYIGLLNGVNL